MKKRLTNSNCEKRNTTGLAQWPCKINLAPMCAPYFDGANIVIAADCCAYAYASIHSDFMKNNITLITCPRSDESFSEKLSSIIAANNIKSVKLLRMEVPCCCGIENGVRKAVSESEKTVPLEVVTISTDGKILD